MSSLSSQLSLGRKEVVGVNRGGRREGGGFKVASGSSSRRRIIPALWALMLIVINLTTQGTAAADVVSFASLGGDGDAMHSMGDVAMMHDTTTMAFEAASATLQVNDMVPISPMEGPLDDASSTNNNGNNNNNGMITYRFNISTVYFFHPDFDIIDLFTSGAVRAEVQDLTRRTRNFYRRVTSEQYPQSYFMVDSILDGGLAGELAVGPVPLPVVILYIDTNITYRIASDTPPSDQALQSTLANNEDFHPFPGVPDLGFDSNPRGFSPEDYLGFVHETQPVIGPPRVFVNAIAATAAFVDLIPDPTPPPTPRPTRPPSNPPTRRPTRKPTTSPTKRPTRKPTASPTQRPSSTPVPGTPNPTKRPTRKPTNQPSTPVPGTPNPTKRPTRRPTFAPITAPTAATNPPTKRPTRPPTFAPVPTPTTPPPTPQPTTIINLTWQIQPYEAMTANVGDSVRFVWSNSGFHNVYRHPSGTCDTTGSVELAPSGGSGDFTYTFSSLEEGTSVYFACQVGPHCQLGMLVRFDIGTMGGTGTIRTRIRITYQVGTRQRQPGPPTMPSEQELRRLESATVEFYQQTISEGFGGTFIRQVPLSFADQPATTGWTTTFVADQVFSRLPTTDEVTRVIETADYILFIVDEVTQTGPYFAQTQGIDQLVAGSSVVTGTPAPITPTRPPLPAPTPPITPTRPPLPAPTRPPIPAPTITSPPSRRPTGTPTSQPSNGNFTFTGFNQNMPTREFRAASSAFTQLRGIVTGDLTNQTTPNMTIDTINPDPTARPCSLPPEVDDLHICFSTNALLSGSNIRGRGALMLIRPSTDANPFLPFVSAIDVRPDVFSVDGPDAFQTVIRTLAFFSLGVGIQWPLFNLINDDDTANCRYRADTNAGAQFQLITGCSADFAIPVEPNTCDLWDSTCFGSREILTRGGDLGNKVISNVTIGSLQDMGYTVDYSGGDLLTDADFSAECMCEMQSTHYATQFGSDYGTELGGDKKMTKTTIPPISDEALAEATTNGLNYLSEMEELYGVSGSDESLADGSSTFWGDKAVVILIEDGDYLRHVIVRA